MASSNHSNHAIANANADTANDASNIATSGTPGSTTATINPSILADYDLSRPINSDHGLRSGLTSYGDSHFSLFLRKVFIKGLGFGDDACKCSTTSLSSEPPTTPSHIFQGSRCRVSA